MGAQYKVGDRVRIVISPFCGETRRAGAVGTVSRVPSRVRGDVEIEFKGDAGPWGFRLGEIEHADYKPVKGDRVRVVLEGEVAQVYSDGDFGIELVENYRTDFPHEADISVEKIEPPVEVFQPGDVVRSLSEPDWLYLIGTDGYAEVGSGRYYADGPDTHKMFTSDGYARVNLSS